jgi:hypothetical protein
MQTVPFTTGEVYSIQHYLIKIVSNLPQVNGFLRILRFPPPLKLRMRKDARLVMICKIAVEDVAIAKKVRGYGV